MDEASGDVVWGQGRGSLDKVEVTRQGRVSERQRIWGQCRAGSRMGLPIKVGSMASTGPRTVDRRGNTRSVAGGLYGGRRRGETETKEKRKNDKK